MGVMRVKEIQLAFEKHKKRSAKGLLTGLYRAGLFLQRESQKIVPVDTSTLKASANTRMYNFGGFNVMVTVSYGTDYALYVHEDLEARHKPGKQAKFLEKPLREKRMRMADIVEEAARFELR